jgi:acetyltransferase-like isoleucine patch superfamily enzyme
MARLGRTAFGRAFFELLDKRDNRFHPLVWLHGTPKIGRHVYIGAMSLVNGKGARVRIGDYCDIASFVSINAADSHRRAIGLAADTERRDITVGHHVFIGSHSVVLGGARIGHHSVVAAGTVVRAGKIPPYSLVIGNPMMVKPRYYDPKSRGRR